MAEQPGKFSYRLGIDVGVASLGIAILEMQDGISTETGEPNFRIHSGSVRPEDRRF